MRPRNTALFRRRRGHIEALPAHLEDGSGSEGEWTSWTRKWYGQSWHGDPKVPWPLAGTSGVGPGGLEGIGQKLTAAFARGERLPRGTAVVVVCAGTSLLAGNDLYNYHKVWGPRHPRSRAEYAPSGHYLPTY
ncbi:hypothetical protein AK812_SmicGene20846 [Symbiodinium microadriaticum]|uniref:Uncharacterized protein n=1 Tax=Symbiodinium microadriaticum TaxID=2951 RepID=A0A1Q9DP07_SYMMI|nr:hypothetical protein AK812_SmicGene20846 [Symbiodinium microadriaticum]